LWGFQVLLEAVADDREHGLLNFCNPMIGARHVIFSTCWNTQSSVVDCVPTLLKCYLSSSGARERVLPSNRSMAEVDAAADQSNNTPI
jgi:hypothetical protein